MKKFRSIERSNPAFERDGLTFITVKSAHLAGRGDICVYIPENCPANCSVTLLLHGVYGSAWSWSLSAGVHLLLAQAIQKTAIKPMILVMPSDGLWGDGSGYVQQKSQNFEQWIVEDVIHAVRTLFPRQITHSSPFFIAGLSMGGYGAMRLGATYSHIFKGFAGLSSITTLADFSLFVEEDLQHYQPGAEPPDLFTLLKRNRNTLKPFRFDCGVSDLLIMQNRTLHAQLLAANIPHIYQEQPGAHEWTYWKNNIIKTLLFFDQLTPTL